MRESLGVGPEEMVDVLDAVVMATSGYQGLVRLVQVGQLEVLEVIQLIRQVGLRVGSVVMIGFGSLPATLLEYRSGKIEYSAAPCLLPRCVRGGCCLTLLPQMQMQMQTQGIPCVSVRQSSVRQS